MFLTQKPGLTTFYHCSDDLLTTAVFKHLIVCLFSRCIYCQLQMQTAFNRKNPFQTAKFHDSSATFLDFPESWNPVESNRRRSEWREFHRPDQETENAWWPRQVRKKEIINVTNAPWSQNATENRLRKFSNVRWKYSQR